MKRSEVIEILVGKFKSGEIPEPYMWANDILDILERRLKMAPPQVEGAYEDGKLLKRYWEEE